MPDNDIIHKFIIGDMKAFEQIFRKYARSMQLTALSIYRDTDVAEDAVQETFVYLWNHRGKIKSGESLEGYLHASVKHYVLNYLRHLHVCQEKEEEIIREQEWLGRQSGEEDESCAVSDRFITGILSQDICDDSDRRNELYRYSR